MTQTEWENASVQERNAEIERCKDPVYLYNTYWRTKDQPVLTIEKWKQLKEFSLKQRYTNRRVYYPQPVLPEDCFIAPEFKKPK